MPATMVIWRACTCLLYTSDDLNEWAPKEHVSLSLPSLRMDNFSQSLLEKTTKVRKSGLTFAAEAGTCLLSTSRCV